MLRSDKACLVIVDVQGRLATLMHQREEFFANLVKIIKGVRVLGLPVLWNEQLPDKLGETIPEIKAILKNMALLVKNTFSCCGNQGFSEQLTGLGRKQVLLVGMETHVCVYQTAVDLLGEGFEVHLVADAVSSRTLENKQIGIGAMRDLGARVTSVEMALFEMLQVAEGEKFKQIINIVK